MHFLLKEKSRLLSFLNIVNFLISELLLLHVLILDLIEDFINLVLLIFWNNELGELFLLSLKLSLWFLLYYTFLILLHILFFLWLFFITVFNDNASLLLHGVYQLSENLVWRLLLFCLLRLLLEKG